MEAVELDDLDSIEGILSWRNVKARKYREFPGSPQRYTYRVLQATQMKLILLCVWAEPVVLGSAKTALKFKYEI